MGFHAAFIEMYVLQLGFEGAVMGLTWISMVLARSFHVKFKVLSWAPIVLPLAFMEVYNMMLSWCFHYAFVALQHSAFMDLYYVRL